MIRHLIRAIALLFLFAAVPAAAQSYYFEVTNSAGAVVTSFTLPSQPRPPTIAGKEGSYFYFEDVPVNYNGSKNIDYVTFWKVTSPTNIVLSYEDPNEGDYIFQLYSTDGRSIYTGPESAPNFQPGTYAVYNANGAYTLTVGLPEPQTWLMMIIGFGAVGGALRRRHRFKGTSRGSTALAAAA
ncbi:MAG TPA: PEPxxWA-CTERM sorting domain-containing protein [Allosphingosinicella sp.]